MFATTRNPAALSNASRRVRTAMSARNIPVVQSLESRCLMSASLIPGGVVPGKITTAREVDSYTFAATPGSTVEINTNATRVDNAFSAKFNLYNPSGGRVKTWYNLNSIRFENLVGGKYTLTVNDDRGTNRGQYAVGLEGLSPISPHPVALSRGGVVNDTINAPLDEKEYVFSATAGSTIQLNTKATTVDAAFSAHFTLYNSAGGQVRTWYNNNSVRIEKLAAGQYMLKVNDDRHVNRGKFAMGLEFLSMPYSPDATPLANNVVTKGSIAAVLDVKQFTFAATNSTVSFVTNATAVDSAFSARFTLYDAQGAQKRLWYNRGNLAVSALTPGGYYMLQVQDDRLASRGSFTLSAQGVRPVSFAPFIGSLSAAPSPVTLGQNVTLTAKTVTDLANDVSAVRFYVESNGKPGLQTGTGGDMLVGTDASAAGGYTTVFSTKPLTRKTYSLYAQATDTNGAIGNIVTTLLTVK
jgi:hypothetical protein